jgi:hypothetical protein
VAPGRPRLFTFAAVEGSGRASPRGAGWWRSAAWVLAVPALLQAGPGRPSRARALFRGLMLSRAGGSRRSRVLRGMGARGVCFTSSRSRAAFSRRYPIEGCPRFEPRARAARGFYVAWVPAVPALHQAGSGYLLTLISHRGLPLSRARGSPRSRVLRGMGTRGACFTSGRPRVAFSRRCPIEGCFRFEPGARAARGFYAAWVPAAPALHQAGPGRPSRADIPSRAVLVSF